jgi:glycosyltransferase involved in cell wall biosynthesis
MKIEAVIPCFNAGAYLEDSVNSLLDQSTPVDAIHVINDGSNDPATLAVLSRISEHPRIRVHRNETNIGRASSVNRYFDSTDADYVILQDADDRALHQRVEEQIRFMEEHPTVGCSSSFVRYINRNGKVIGRGFLDITSQTKFDAYLNSGEPFGLFCPAVILRGKVLRNPALRFRSIFWPADDMDLWNRIAEADWHVLAQPLELVEYRVHGGSVVTKNFHFTRIKFEYLRACLRARRNCTGEPSWDDFRAEWDRVSLIGKANRWRKAEAKAQYRAAGFSIAESKYLPAVFQLLLASILQPSYIAKRLPKQARAI